MLIEFRNYIGYTRESLLDLGTLMVFLFPPVIMHTVYLESQCGDDAPPPALFRRLLTVMYVLSPVAGAYTVLAIFDTVPHPEPLGPWIGGVIGGLFTLTGIYATALMLRRQPKVPTPDQRTAAQRHDRALHRPEPDLHHPDVPARAAAARR